MAKAKRIGGDWLEVTDPSTGKVYYANQKTKETSWNMPDEVKQLQKQAATKEVSSPQTTNDSSEDEWLERTDPKTGRTYYYNKKLKQTAWTRPQKNTSASVDDGSSDDAWVSRVDNKTKRTYYFNSVTRVTQWDMPDSMKPKPTADTSPHQSKSSSPTMSSRLSKRLSTRPNAEDQPAFESAAAPAPPSNRASTRASIRLGAIPTPGARNRMSMADVARFKKAEVSGDVERAEEVAPVALDDKFAKLRALKNRAGVADGPVQTDDVDVDTSINIEDLAASVLAEVTYDLKMGSYAGQYLNLKRKGFFSTETTTAEKILSWKNERIKTSLHPLSDAALIHDAKLCFQNILSYMGDAASKHPNINASKVFRIAINSPEELRDEVYCQLIKQTTSNPNPSSCLRGWELIACCCGLFPASSKLEKYFLSYIRQNAEQPPHNGVGKFAEYSMLKMKRTMELGPRDEIASELEFESVKNINPVQIRIHMLDGVIIPLEAESWTTVKELNEAMSKRLKIEDPTPFGVFEINSFDEERNLEENDRILDIVSYWDSERRLAKRAKNAPDFKFVYKVRLFFDIKEDDINAIEVAYHQAVHDVTDSRYPCEEEDCFRLAALQAQERFGDYNGTDVFGNELEAFLPSKYYDDSIVDQLKAAITDTYKLVKGYDRHEAMNNYLDYVRAWKIYGSSYYFAEPQANRDLPKDVVLAINAKGVLVVDPSTKDFLSDYPYSEIVTWGHSATTFVLVVGNLVRQNKLYFKTDQGTEMNNLVHAYVNKLVEE